MVVAAQQTTVMAPIRPPLGWQPEDLQGGTKMVGDTVISQERPLSDRRKPGQRACGTTLIKGPAPYGFLYAQCALQPLRQRRCWWC